MAAGNVIGNLAPGSPGLHGRAVGLGLVSGHIARHLPTWVEAGTIVGQMAREHFNPGGAMGTPLPAKDFNDQPTGHIAGAVNGRVGMYEPGARRPNGGTDPGAGQQPYL